MTQKRTGFIGVAALVISIAALGVSVFALSRKPAAEPILVSVPELVQTQQAQDIQYVLYIGTNDKDTNEPVFDEEEARARAEAILTEHFGGFTIQDARGGWRNDDGSIAHEYTIVVYLSDTTLDEVHAACDDIVSEFNQSAILIQQDLTTTEFYAGE